MAEPYYVRDAVWSLLNRTAGILLIVLLSPVLVGSAVCIKLGSPGSVLFRQTRIGYCGRPFKILKFRTMYEGAELDWAEVVASEGVEVSAFTKVPNDPRVTRVGRFLRRSSLDELPQLWNVVRGDMHLVGPRPLTPHEFALCTAVQWRRALVRPGITGLWQLSGRSDVDAGAALHLDSQYVVGRTILLDLKLLLRTLAVPFTRRGAY